MARARDILARFLHNLVHILQEMVQDFARDAARIITCKFGTFFVSDLARIGARLCKNRARKGTYRVHLPSKSCKQDSCTILHDLASSFLLGVQPHCMLRSRSWYCTCIGTKSGEAMALTAVHHFLCTIPI